MVDLIESAQTPTNRLMIVARSSAALATDWQELIARLYNEGFEVHVLAGDDGGLDALARRGALVRPLPGHDPASPAMILASYLIMQPYFLEQPPMLVHAMDGLLPWAAAFAARQAGALAVVATVDDLRGLSQEQWGPLPAAWTKGATPLVEGAFGWLIGQLDRVYVPSQGDLELLQAHGLVEPRKAEILLGGVGVDLERFNPDAAPTREAAREALGLPATWRQIAGWVVGPQDGGAEASLGCWMVNQLAQAQPGVGWLVVPRIPGTPRPAGLAALEARGLARWVDHSAADELPARYAALDVLVSMSGAQGPRPELLEAQAMRLAVIAPATRGNQSICKDRHTGLLTPVGDRRAMLDAVRTVLRDPAGQRALAERGRQWAAQRLDRSAVEEQLLRSYDDLLTAQLA
jgi:glycosyltransferase involved in cell wall biosynthesis